MFIEFIGPPGSGKSTVISNIKNERNTSIHTYSDYLLEYVVENSDKNWHKPLFKLYPKLSRVIEPYYRRKAFDTYISDNPDFLHAFFNCAETTKRKVQFFKWCRAAAERYQIGIDSKEESDIFVLNEAFHHLGAHMMVESRKSASVWEFDEYFNSIPTPDLIIHIDVDSNTCLSRQQGRGRVVPSVEMMPKEYSNLLSIQEEFQRACVRVREHSGGKTDAIVVDNSGDVNESASIIDEKIKELYLKKMADY